ncbi:unnamed protein product [Nippostrongylus brasiliensis]|uniref:DUF2088 domain-containing protein n=1 Tax=Nippostrongylus brasiliensis TaxID=27835 RepID=A0A0N4XSY4_NIPBR|nr:unnamed protein product [Nippostrongylus brasiliensis]
MRFYDGRLTAAVGDGTPRDADVETDDLMKVIRSSVSTMVEASNLFELITLADPMIYHGRFNVPEAQSRKLMIP